MRDLASCEKGTMKVLVGVNTLTDVAQEVYSSHCNFWSKTVQMYPGPENQFLFFTPKRMSIDRMRNEAARIALEQECDYLMFLDDDVIVQPSTFKSLLEADLDIVMAHTFIRGYPFHPMCFKYVLKEGNQNVMEHYDKVVEEADEKGIARCDAIGFSCALIKCSLLKKVTTPFFVTINGSHTEDVYFCIKARREVGDEVSIGVDTKVPTAHMFEKFFVAQENVELLRKMHEDIYGKPEPEIDHPLHYIRRALEIFDKDEAHAGTDQA